MFNFYKLLSTFYLDSYFVAFECPFISAYHTIYKIGYLEKLAKQNAVILMKSLFSSFVQFF